MKKFKKMLSILISVCMIMNLSSLTLFAEGNPDEETSAVQIAENGEKIYYLANGGNADAGNFDVWTNKTITGTEKEDEFEVELQVGSIVKAIPNDAAVVLVIETAGSMTKGKDGTVWYDEASKPADAKTRMDYTREAVMAFAQAFAKDAGDAQRMLSIVQFGNTAQAVLPWTNINASGVLDGEVKTAVDAVKNNFLIESNKGYWNEAKALTDFGKIDYWNGTEVDAVMTGACPMDCSIAEEHSHCARCGLTSSDHKHVVGCTLSGCLNPYEGPHTHCCVHGGDSLDPYYIRYNRWSGGYGYRCKNPDPAHTHNYYDADYFCMGGTYYFSGVWNVGSNLESGLLLARNLVTVGQSAGGAIQGIDNTYVILLSDGHPTWATNETSTTETEFIANSGPALDAQWKALKDIVVDTGEAGDRAIAEDIKSVAELYAVHISSDADRTLSCGSGHPLTGVTFRNWTGGTGNYYVGADYVLNVPKVEELESKITTVSDRIEALSKAWTVTDALSEDVSFGEFTLNGTYANYTPASGDKDAVVSWNIGKMQPESGSGSVADPYIYTLKYTVKLNSLKDTVKTSSLAFDAGTSDDAIPISNGANLQYLVVDEDDLKNMTPEEIKSSIRNAMFANPSVKGLYSDVTFINKNEATGEIVEGVGFTLYDSFGVAYGTEVFSDAEGKVIFTNIPQGEYTLKETTVPTGMQPVEDIDLIASWGGAKLSDGNSLPEVIMHEPIGVITTEESTEATTEESSEATTEESTETATEEPTEAPTEESTEAPTVESTEESTEEEPEIEIPDEDVPKGDSPDTGDAYTTWLAIEVISGAALIGARVYKKRKED